MKPETPTRFGRKAKLLLVLISMGAALGLAELVLRGLGGAPALKSLDIDAEESVYRRSDNPLLGYELKADYRNPAPDFSRSYARTNAHGQRDIERELVKAPGVRRILMLGDSVVEGHDIRDIDDTLSRQLERLYPEGGVEVLNFGVSGYCTRAEVELLRVKGLAFDPDVILLVFVANDFDDFNREAYRLRSATRRLPGVERLFSASHLFRTLAVRFDLFGFGADADPVGWNRRAIGDNNVVRGLELLQELADSRGFEAAVAIWPVFEDDRVIDPEPMPGSDELIVERLAAAQGLPTVRLSPAFRADLESLPESDSPRLRYTVGDRLHPSAAGIRVAALALREFLKRPGSTSLRPRRPDDGSAVREAASRGQATPDYAHVYNNEGLDHKQIGRPDRAEQAFRRALDERPDFAEAHNNLANLFSEQGRLEQAADHYRRALDSDGAIAEIHVNLALVLQRLGRVDEALAEYRAATRLRPDDVALRLRLATILARSGLLEESELQFRGVLEMDPDHAAAHHGLGNVLAATDRAPLAIEHYRTASRLRESWSPPLVAWARIVAVHPDPKVRDPAAALRMATRAVELTGRRDPLALDTLAIALDAGGTPVEAERAAREALEAAVAAGNTPLAESIRRRLPGEQ